MTTELAVQDDVQPQRRTLAVGQNGLQLQTFDDMYKFAKCVVTARFAPRGMDTPEAVFVALQMGAELGISPMMALQNIAVINGRPGIFGDLGLALVRASGQLEVFEERFEGVEYNDDFAAICTVKRRGFDQAVERFTVADAKRANLWGKEGPWTFHPKRMLKFKARNFVLRDLFADTLKGFKTTDELEDYPEDNGAPLPQVGKVSVLPPKAARALTATVAIEPEKVTRTVQNDAPAVDAVVTASPASIPTPEPVPAKVEPPVEAVVVPPQPIAHTPVGTVNTDTGELVEERPLLREYKRTLEDLKASGHSLYAVLAAKDVSDKTDNQLSNVIGRMADAIAETQKEGDIFDEPKTEAQTEADNRAAGAKRGRPKKGEAVAEVVHQKREQEPPLPAHVQALVDDIINAGLASEPDKIIGNAHFLEFGVNPAMVVKGEPEVEHISQLGKLGALYMQMAVKDKAVQRWMIHPDQT